MSKIKVRQPVIHIPRFPVYAWHRVVIKGMLEGLGIEVWPKDIAFDTSYYFTDLEGWNKILPDLALKSSLYRPDIFDCENYAMKAHNECAMRYGLNGLLIAIGTIPQGWHGFNIVVHPEGLLLWEPNDGFEFSGSLFDIGDFDYIPRIVLL